MDKCDFTKTITVKSVAQNTEIKAYFFNDIELKIIINCGQTSSLQDNLCKSPQSKKKAESNADSSDLALDLSNSQITITFFTLENDIDSLVRGYLGTFLELDFCVNLVRENNVIFVDSHLSKDEILSRLSQKDIIQSCEQIELNDKKINHSAIIMPFNGSRAKISREILEKNSNFFAIPNANLGKFLVRIVRGESSTEIAESFDTNPKNAIYKAIGKALDLSLQDSQGKSKQSAPTSSLRDLATPNRGNPSNLLDATIFLNFRLEIESLKILLLQKCTFIVCAEKPAFSVIKFAQKFGITLIAFTQGDFLILTHQMRFRD